MGIQAAYCTCTAGLHGTCNHIVAMFFRIEAAVASGQTRPAKTSVGCQWDIPSGNKVVLKATKAEDLYFTKTKYTSSKALQEKQKNAKQQFNSYKSSLHTKQQKELKNTVEIRNKLFSIVGPGIAKSTLAEVMLGKKAATKKAHCILPPPLKIYGS